MLTLPPLTVAQVKTMSSPGDLPDFGLPECHSRREFDAKEQRFFCAHPQIGAPDALVSPDYCRICPYWQQPPPPKFRSRPEPKRRQRRALACQHLGEEIGLRNCPSCRGHVQIKVFACRHPAHAETTRDECLRCGDYVASHSANADSGTVSIFELPSD